MTDDASTPATAVPQAAPAGPAVAARLPSPARLLAAQIGYQIRQLLANGRTLAIGIGLPVICSSRPRARAARPTWRATRRSA